MFTPSQDRTGTEPLRHRVGHIEVNVSFTCPGTIEGLARRAL